jgi:hypothetical protein
MPSSNTTPATAIELGPLVGTTPVTTVETIDHVFQAWWKYEAVTGDTAISFFPFGSTGAAMYVYEGLASANEQTTEYLNIQDTIWKNRPAYVPVTPGLVYYFVLQGSAAETRTFDFRVQRLPDLPVPVGSYVIPDSHDLLPVVFISPAGEYLKLKQPYARGETSQVLKNGISMSEDVYDHTFNLYTAQFELIESVGISGWTSAFSAGGTNKVDKFYVSPANGANIRKVYTISLSGTLSDAVATLPGSPLRPIGIQPSNDETILYWQKSGSSTNSPILQHDLVNDIALSNLAAGVVGYQTGDFHVLDDDRIAVLYVNNSTGDALVNFYNADGSTDLAVPITGYPAPNSVHRMASGEDDLTSVVVWIKPEENEADSTFLSIDTTTGAITVTATNVATFIDAVYMAEPGVADPIADYGIPESCHFFVARVAIEDDCDCECPPRPAFGGGQGFSGDAEGDDPTRAMTPWTVVCEFGGEVPTGTNGTDTENWAS